MGSTFDLPVMKRSASAQIPTRAHEDDAGLDLYCDDEIVVISSGCSANIHSSISADIMEGHFGLLVTRSSVGKRGLRLCTGASIIDAGYHGEIGIPMHNDSDTEMIIRKGDRIAQLIIVKFVKVQPVLVDSFPDSERGEGGFGSSGR